MNSSIMQATLNISKKLKVLYVEDCKEVRESTLFLLENFFDNIVVGFDGAEGLELYKNQFYNENSYFDIVINDIQMPNLNGIDMAKAIYEINKEQKIIIVSAYSDKEYLIPLLNMGIEGFMQKPLSIEHVNDVIKNICLTFKQSSIVNLSDDYTYNCLSKVLQKDDQIVTLNNNEVKLLDLLLENVDKSFTLTDLFNHIFYDEPYKEFSSDSIRAFIKRFRKKLPVDLILNNRTLGYTINLKN